MKPKYQEVLEELKRTYHVSDEVIAVKMRITAMTVYRWRMGEYEPSYAGGKMLERILKGYRNSKKEKGNV